MAGLGRIAPAPPDATAWRRSLRPDLNEAAVESKPSLGRLIRKICGLAILGFLAITLAGPIIAVLVTVLSFALVGFLFWLPLHALLRRKEGGWRDGVHRAREFGGRCLGAAGGVWCGTLRAAHNSQEALRSTASFVGAVLLEALSGTLVAVFLVGTCWPPHGLNPGVFVLAGLIGAATGVLVVVSRRRPAPEATVEVASEGMA